MGILKDTHRLRAYVAVTPATPSTLSAIAGGSEVFLKAFNIFSGSGLAGTSYFLRPDGTSYFLRPDGTSQYVRP